MVIEGMSVFPVSQGIPQGTIASPMVSSYILYMEGVLMSRMFLQVSLLKCRCFPNRISRYPMYVEGISRYMSRLLLKVSFKVSLKVALKARHKV